MSITRIFRRLGLPLFLFLLSQLFLVLILHFEGQQYFNHITWIRWDAGHYIQIAKEGYNFFPCAGHFGYPEDATEMCGNAGWFPGYAWLVKGLSVFFSDIKVLSHFTSKIMFLLSLMAFAAILKLDRINLRNILIMLIPSFWFGSIYYSSSFPMSTIMFTMLIGIFFFIRNQKLLCYFMCLLAATIYPTGILFSTVLSITSFFFIEGTLKRKLTAIYPMLFGLLGLGLVFLSLHIQTGEWSAFLQIQSKYGHGIHNPLENIWRTLKSLNWDLNDQQNYIILQSLIIVILYVNTLVYFIKNQLYKEKLFLLAFLFFNVYLLFPWTVGGNLSVYRSESLLMPASLMYQKLPAKWLGLLSLALIIMCAAMSHLFFIDVLY